MAAPSTPPPAPTPPPALARRLADRETARRAEHDRYAASLREPTNT